MALYCNLKLNMYVCAACLNTNSEGAQKLLDQCDPKRFHLIELDIRKCASILHIEKTIINLLAKEKDLEFSYLVNNAGIMCFGEFEWQTNAIIENQINTNLFGTMNFTRSFLPLIRKHKTRIINVTSHCALEVRIQSIQIFIASNENYIFHLHRLCPDWQLMPQPKSVSSTGTMHYVSK